jgi:hypothetical protein
MLSTYHATEHRDYKLPQHEACTMERLNQSVHSRRVVELKRDLNAREPCLQTAQMGYPAMCLNHLDSTLQTKYPIVP